MYYTIYCFKGLLSLSSSPEAPLSKGFLLHGQSFPRPCGSISTATVESRSLSAASLAHYKHSLCLAVQLQQQLLKITKEGITKMRYQKVKQFIPPIQTYPETLVLFWVQLGFAHFFIPLRGVQWRGWDYNGMNWSSLFPLQGSWGFPYWIPSGKLT